MQMAAQIKDCPVIYRVSGKEWKNGGERLKFFARRLGAGDQFLRNRALALKLPDIVVGSADQFPEICGRAVFGDCCGVGVIVRINDRKRGDR